MEPRDSQPGSGRPPAGAGRGVRRWGWRGWLLACCASVPVPGLALTEVVLQLDSSWRSDSNPLRFVEGTDVQAALGRDRKSDTVLSTDVRGALIYPLDSPQTRLMLTGQLGRRSYDQLTQLDNTEYAYRAAFEWRYGDLWRGELWRSQDRALYTYLDGSLTSREMVSRTTDNVALTLRATPDIDIPVVLQNRHTRYDNPVNWPFESVERSLDVGARFNASTGSMVAVGLKSTDARFPRRTPDQVAALDSGYRDSEVYAESDWQYSVMTRFSGRIAALHRNYDTLGSKSFSALTSELRVAYDYSPLTRLTLDLWRRPYGLTDISTLYTVQTGGQLGVRWQATPKTRLSLLALSEEQRYQFASLQAGQVNPQLKRVRWGGGWVYAFNPELRLYVDGFRERLDRGSLGGDISQNVLRAGIEYTYENLSGLAQRTGLGGRR